MPMTCVTSAYKPFVDAQGDIFGKAIASCSSSTYAIVITVEIYKGTNNLVGSRTEYCYNTNVCVATKDVNCVSGTYYTFGKGYHQHSSGGTKYTLPSAQSGRTQSRADTRCRRPSDPGREQVPLRFHGKRG